MGAPASPECSSAKSAKWSQSWDEWFTTWINLGGEDNGIIMSSSSLVISETPTAASPSEECCGVLVIDEVVVGEKADNNTTSTGNVCNWNSIISIAMLYKWEGNSDKNWGGWYCCCCCCSGTAMIIIAIQTAATARKNQLDEGNNTSSSWFGSLFFHSHEEEEPIMARPGVERRLGVLLVVVVVLASFPTKLDDRSSSGSCPTTTRPHRVKLLDVQLRVRVLIMTLRFPTLCSFLCKPIEEWGYRCEEVMGWALASYFFNWRGEIAIQHSLLRMYVLTYGKCRPRNGTSSYLYSKIVLNVDTPSRFTFWHHPARESLSSTNGELCRV